MHNVPPFSTFSQNLLGPRSLSNFYNVYFYRVLHHPRNSTLAILFVNSKIESIYLPSNGQIV